MAFPTIDQAFIKQFGAEVHQAYQRRGSKLRGSIRTQSGVQGSSHIFQKAGKGSATQKARNGVIPPMSVDHSNVECTLADWYAGDWIDRLDMLKTNIDERMVVANASAWALGRKTDELIFSELLTAGSGQTVPDGSGDLANSAALTLAKVFAALEILNNGDVPDDGERFAWVTPGGWSDLMAIPQFSNTDYIGQSELPYGGAPFEMKRWMGVTWAKHTHLNTTKVSTLATGVIYHRTACGHAIGMDVTPDITWHGDRAAHFVNNMMSQGAKLIDATGVALLKWTE